MPYFVRVVVPSGEGRDDGAGEMLGYWIRLRGTTVVAQWGPVEVVEQPRGRVCWCGKLGEKRHPCRTADLARKLMKSLAEDLLCPEKGYRPLGFRVRIFPPRKRRPKATAKAMATRARARGGAPGRPGSPRLRPGGDRASGGAP